MICNANTMLIINKSCIVIYRNFVPLGKQTLE